MLPEQALCSLIENAQLTHKHLRSGKSPPDHAPAIRLVLPERGISFLFSEYDAKARSFFGLSDWATGFLELGCTRLSVLESGDLGLIRVDHDFVAEGTIMDYLRKGFGKGRPVGRVT